MPSGACRGYSATCGPTVESGLSQELALLATKLCGATQMSWLWELKHASCPFLTTRLHARIPESAGPHDTAPGPQILELKEAGTEGHERTTLDPDTNAFGASAARVAYAVLTWPVSIWLSWLSQPHAYKEHPSQCLAPQGSHLSGCLDTILGSPRSLSGFLP